MIPARGLSRSRQSGRRLATSLRAVRRDLRKAVRLGDEPRSSLSLCRDLLIYRALRVIPRLARPRAQRVVLHGGVAAYYRRNRGDLHTLREVWLDDAYRLPFDLQPRTVIDLGANIGLTSLWLISHYTVDRVVAVEPSAANVHVLRKNLPACYVTVLQAAVGPVDGSALFADSTQSHLGHVGAEGSRVRQVSMHTVLQTLAPGTMVDLLKIDIEGAEGQLLSGDLSWLRRVRSIIIEIHPPIVDRDEIVERIRAHGFEYLAAGSVWPHSMDAFVRRDPAPDRTASPRGDD